MYTPEVPFEDVIIYTAEFHLTGFARNPSSGCIEYGDVVCRYMTPNADELKSFVRRHPGTVVCSEYRLVETAGRRE